MPSDAQIAANRRNAEKSTGPKTDAGKAASARNALKHGLRAEQLLIFDEREDDFRTLHDGLIEAFAPGDDFEETLVERIAIAQWRLRRVWRAEAAAINHDAFALARERARDAARAALAAEFKANPPAGMEKAAPETIARAARDGAEAMSDDELMAASGAGDGDGDGPLALDTAVWPSKMAEFSRYEAMLERTLHRAARDLERHQARRRYEVIAAGVPVVGDDVAAARKSAIEESAARRAQEAGNRWEHDRSFQAMIKYAKRSQFHGHKPRDDETETAAPAGEPPS